ncbi:MAG: hypothetical protein AUH85_05970 [Chloroflexi bacterium 13_1_40CM_4_68_4]|nr:MAG: hypothetical protein AUH85_05970 [Chloroflexi bacterium 13_1_40CM_4_68_4]
MIDQERRLAERLRAEIGAIEVPSRPLREARRARPALVVIAAIAAIVIAIGAGQLLASYRGSVLATPTPNALPPLPVRIQRDEAIEHVRVARNAPGVHYERIEAKLMTASEAGLTAERLGGRPSAAPVWVVAVSGTIGVQATMAATPGPSTPAPSASQLILDVHWSALYIIDANTGDVLLVAGDPSLTWRPQFDVLPDHPAAPLAAQTAVPAVATPRPFPDVPLVIADAQGQLTRVTSSGVAKQIPAVCSSSHILAIAPAPDRSRIAVVCDRTAFAGSVVILDSALTSSAIVLPFDVVPREDVIAWSPDGVQVALIVPGACVSPEPVCREKVVLYDLAAGTTRVIQGDRVLLSSLRWTSLGLSYFYGYLGSPGDTGTYVWDGRVWSRYSTRRLEAINASGQALLGDQVWDGAISHTYLFQRVDGVERQLTPGTLRDELPVALLDDGTAIAWHSDATTLTVVRYRNGVTTFETSLSPATSVRWGGLAGDWIFGVIGDSVYAYSAADASLLRREGLFAIVARIAVPVR